MFKKYTIIVTLITSILLIGGCGTISVNDKSGSKQNNSLESSFSSETPPTPYMISISNTRDRMDIMKTEIRRLEKIHKDPTPYQFPNLSVEDVKNTQLFEYNKDYSQFKAGLILTVKDHIKYLEKMKSNAPRQYIGDHEKLIEAYKKACYTFDKLEVYSEKSAIEAMQAAEEAENLAKKILDNVKNPVS